MKIKSLLFVSLFFVLGQGLLAQNSPIDISQNSFLEGFENDSLVQCQWRAVVGTGADVGISNNISYEGDYSFKFEVGNENSFLYSPQFTGTEGGMRVSFYYTNYVFESPSSFRVGYFVQNDPVIHWIEETIVAVEGCWSLDNPNGNPGWTPYERDFPANTQSIAIEFLLSEGSNALYLDNFTFSATSCPVPFDFGVFAINAGINGGQSVSLSWNGSSDNYELEFAPFTVYDFESGGMAPWQGGTWKWSRGETYGDPSGHNSEHCVYSDLYPDEKNTLNENDNYLVLPSIKLNGSISFYAKKEPKETLKGHKTTDPETRFVVRVLTEHGNDYVSVGDPVSVSELAWEKYTIELNDPSFVDQNGYVAICHEYPGEKDYYLLIDDITFFSSWSSAPEAITDNAYTFEVEDDTQYAFKLRGSCGGDSYSSWTDSLCVKTFNPNAMPSSYEFLHDGNWNVPTNWKDWYIPQNGTDAVTISDDAIIPACCLAKGTISNNGGSLTIRDGGQFIGNSVMARVLKHIVGYGEGDGNWYLLSAPTVQTLSANPQYPQDCGIVNLLPDDQTVNNETVHMFDLYKFNQNLNEEWQNYRQNINSKNFIYQEGRLYARRESATIEFNVKLAAQPNEDLMAYNADAEFAGWNLIGNAMMCDQYVALFTTAGLVTTDYYRMNAAGTGLVLCSNGAPVAPMEGFFVQVPNNTATYVHFSSTPFQTGNSKSIDVEVTADNVLVDRARVRFGEGGMLGKFTLNENSSKLYISQNGKDYAVVRSDGQGEMPVNFKASKNGSYTISVNAENAEMNYMHLIDNLTGADIDLLATPSYSFEAKTTDYASRFRLVFSANDENGASTGSATFAYFNGSEWNVSNTGEATLQVIDLLGRIVSSETINGNATMSTANLGAGVYVMRLVNGENVKTQKVVVR